MLRALIAGLVALAASACSYGSAVDVAPFKDRIRKPIIATGDYCEVVGKAAPFQVNSAEDCVRLVWKPELRGYVFIDTDKPEDGLLGAPKETSPEDKTDVSMVALGGRLYAGQIQVDKGPAPYQIQLVITSGDAFATMRVLDDKELKALEPRHPRLTFGSDNGRPFVASGSVRDVRAWLKDIAHVALSTPGEGNDPDDMYSIGVLDRQGTPAHAASKTQARDIAKVLKAVEQVGKR